MRFTVNGTSVRNVPVSASAVLKDRVTYLVTKDSAPKDPRIAVMHKGSVIYLDNGGWDQSSVMLLTWREVESITIESFNNKTAN